jgi:hypothetical protein
MVPGKLGIIQQYRNYYSKKMKKTQCQGGKILQTRSLELMKSEYVKDL